MKNLFVFILSVFCCVSAFCAEFTQIDNSFPFYNFGFDKNSKISAFNLNTPITSENDRILVSDDGHLKANNQRIRIFGTNLSNIPASLPKYSLAPLCTPAMVPVRLMVFI